jgi:hypothetical protein
MINKILRRIAFDQGHQAVMARQNIKRSLWNKLTESQTQASRVQACSRSMSYGTRGGVALLAMPLVLRIKNEHLWSSRTDPYVRDLPEGISRELSDPPNLSKARENRASNTVDEAKLLTS